MADKGRAVARRKDRKEPDAADRAKSGKEEENIPEKTENNEGAPAAEEPAGGAVANGQNGEFKVEPMELPPFEIIQG